MKPFLDAWRLEVDQETASRKVKKAKLNADAPAFVPGAKTHRSNKG